MLHVNILSAAGILAADLNGFSDPYVVVRLVRRGTANHETRKGDLVKTDVKPKTLAPEWNSCFTFKDVARLSESLVLIELFDHDRISADDPLGMEVVRIKDMMQAQDGVVSDEAAMPYTQGHIRCRGVSIPTCGMSPANCASPCISRRGSAVRYM